MTIKYLDSYLKTAERINRAKAIIASLQASTMPGAYVIDGMPHAPGVKDKFGDKAAELVDMKERLQRIEAAAEQQRQEIGSFFNSIDKDLERLILRLRYLHGMSWREISLFLGSKYSPSSLRLRASRFLNNTLN